MELQDLSFNYLPPNENQLNLFLYVMQNNLSQLRYILEKNICDVNYIYGPPFEKTVLEIACNEYSSTTNPKCVELLLQHGANSLNCLHSVAVGGNPKLLQLILNQIKKNGNNISNSTIILTLIENMNEERNEQQYAQCVQMLLEFGVDVNIVKSSCPAIYLAAIKNYSHIVAVIINTCFEKVDLDTYTNTKYGSARDIIIMRKLYLEELPKQICGNFKFITKPLIILIQYIKRQQETDFIINHRIMKKENKLENYSDYVLLLCATEENSLNIVRYLLCVGEDLNTCDSWTKLTPIGLASVRGYYKLVDILVKYSSSKNISQALVSMLQSVCLNHKCIEDLQVNHDKCFDILLNKTDMKYNEIANRALYFAIKNQCSEIVIKILQKGASLGSLNLKDRPWTVFVNPTTLHIVLDDCLTIIQSNEFTNLNVISIDFTSILPSYKSDNFEKSYNDKNFPILLESDLKTDDEIFESKVLEYISNKPEFHSTLQHPVINLYLHLKWQKIRSAFYINLLLYILFSIFLILYIIFRNDWDSVTVLTVPIALFLIFLIIREIIQMVIFKINYLKNYDNYLEIALILTTIVLLSITSDNKKAFNQLSSIVIILSALELLFMFTRQFKILFTSMTMLTTVSVTYCKLMLPYFVLILAFSFTFMILFGDESPDNFFAYWGTAILKTIVMLTGEFEAGTLNFFNYPVVSSVIFIFFLFLMNIVLFGVFTALAIGDIEKIKNEAEIQSIIFKIRHISYWEKVTHSISFLKNKTSISNDPKFELTLTKYCKLYHYDNGKKYHINLDKKVIENIKTLVDQKNKFSSPNYKKCPILRHPTLDEREYLRQIRYLNMPE